MYVIFIKRFLDIIGALIMLPFVLLEIIILAPFIWLTDRGPVFYNGERVGKDYKVFKMYKLRSMYVNAPDIRNADGSTFNSDKDPRVTPIGHLLRKTSLDELPQFLNVLFGDMSLIGPRPATKKIFEEEQDEIMKKHFWVKPGVTGYTQAYLRNAIEKTQRYEMDAYYAEHLSFLFDMKIVLKTISTVLKSKNIYHNK